MEKIMAEQNTSGMDNFNNLKKMLEDVTPDAEKLFVKGNKSAGVRLRTTLQSVKALIGDIRKQSLEVK